MNQSITTPLSVYLVDDEVSVVKWLNERIDWTYYNFEVVGYSDNAMEALNFLEHHTVNLLITDINMPKIDGLELIRRAKELTPSLHIVIISAHNRFDYVKKAMKLGVENYLLKPIDNVELQDTLALLADDIKKKSTLRREGDIRVFRSNLLARWVHNDYILPTFREQSGIAQLDLTCKSYVVAIFQLPARDPTLALQLLGYCTQLSAQWERYFFIDNQLRVVGVLPEADPGEEAFWKEHQQRLSGWLDTPVVLCVGTLAESYREVAISWETAQQLLVLSPILKETVLLSAHYPMNRYQRPIIDTLALQYTAALKAKNQLLAVTLGLELIDSTSLLKKKKAIVALLAYSLEIIGTTGETTEELTKHLEHFSALQTIPAWEGWVKDFIHLVLYHAEKTNTILHPYVRKTLELLQGNYEDPELSLQTLADGYDVSAAYLGQLFREYTQSYFNEYLTQVRLEAACSQLLYTQKRVGEIAKTVGFRSQSYFNQIFKKQYIISPLEYRQQHLFQKQK